jgi:hypothetical protein
MHLGMRSLAVLCLIAMAAASRALPVAPVYELEHPNVSGTATGYFHLERLGQRWWFIAPDGSGFFPRAVALLDFSSSGAAGTGFRAYDAVALAPAGSSAYRMVTDEAEDSDSSDVLMPGRSYTVRDPGDTILIGSSRFRPEFTKFQMSMLGRGGTIAWYYYSNSRSLCTSPPCWIPINRDGKPYSADTSDTSHSFALDMASNAYQSRMVNANGFTTPISPPAVIAYGASGTTSYRYYAMPRDVHGNQIGDVSPVAALRDGNTVLDPSNYNVITPVANYPMAASWDVLKNDTAHLLGNVKPGTSLSDHGQTTAPYTIVTGANRVQWWNWSVICPRRGGCTWPSDFIRLVIPGVDSTPRFYIKGMVEKAFTAAPVASQIAEEASQDELLKARYGGSSVNTARINWLNNDLPKLKSAGINAAGQYSYAAYLLELGLYNGARSYTGDGGLRAAMPLALEYIMTLSDWTMRNAGAFKPPLAASPVKNIYANIQTTFCHGYEGRTPDVFDPHYYQAMLNALDFGAGRGAWSGNGNAIPDASRIYAVLSEEADDLFGVDARYHEHLGAAVLMANPYMSADSQYSVVYRDPVLYSKLALRDLLKAKYKTIVALNAAWGTSYTNWNTSSGAVAEGTNSYGTGSAFLDEDGRHVIADCGRDDYNHAFTTTSAIRSDLDHFVFSWSERYAQVLRRAWRTLPNAANLPPLFVPLYSGVDEAYRAMSPYVDGFWINPGEAVSPNDLSFTPANTQSDLRRIVRDTGKPLIVADYLSDDDGELGFDGLVTAATFDPANDSTTITLADAPYRFGAPIDLRLLHSRCSNSVLRPVAVRWTQAARQTRLVVAGNLAACLQTNSHVRVRRNRGAGVFDDATARGNASVARFNAVINFAGDRGVRQVVGLELWNLYPEALVSRGEPQGFGLMTYADNPRDGSSDTAIIGVDRDGYSVGGEDHSWGNLLSGAASLGGYLAGIDGRLR